ncbi:MAG: hypothetical protein RQ761_11005 [Bacteroidales bacterium]|nr:hypothetical protein [Bacteroidales bacterium]
MYDIILNPKATDVNEEGNTLNPLVEYITSRGKFYATVHLDVKIGEEQYISAPDDEKINTVNNASGGEDISIDIEILGPEGGEKIRPLTLRAEIMEGEASPGQTLDKAAVQNLIAARLYNLNITAYFNGNSVGNKSGTASNSSNVDIL